MKTLARMIGAPLLFVACFLSPASAQVNVLMNHNDVARTGANTSETFLTPTNVNPTQFGLLFSQSVDGYIVGQPLYMQGVSIPGQGTYNVVFVATLNDTVYAFDAQTPGAPPLWKTSFANPAAGVTAVPISDQACGNTTRWPQIGIAGSPVIDSSSGTLYVVAKTLENGAFVHRLHALDITTGLEKFGGPVRIAASSINSSGKTIAFNDEEQMVRSGLLLLNGVVYAAFDSLGCTGGGEHGWLMLYDASSLAQLATFDTTPNKCCGTFWEASGAAADEDGNIYLQTGDGLFDANTGSIDYGDSLLKFTYGQSGLVLDDYFTPYNQAYLLGNDLDLGSSGVLVLPDQPAPLQHLAVGGGKGGTIYLVNRDDLGEYCNGCASDTQIVQSIPNFGSMNSTPAYWNNTVYVAGGNGVSAYTLANGQLNLQSSSLKLGGLASPMISASGTSNGIVWLMNYNILYAFNAANLANTLYFSTQSGSRDSIPTVPHFAMPMIANGRVYVGTTTTLAVFGLFPAIQGESGNQQTATANTALPVPIQIQLADPYSGNPFVGVTITFSDGGKGGVFSNPTAVTDANGDASTTYTLPKKATIYTITASSSGYASAKFTETAVAGAAYKAGAVSGSGQTAAVSSPLPAPLVASVLDAYGNAVAGVTVNFSDGGAGGSFSSTAPVTNSQGRVSVTYTTPANPGTVKIAGSVSGIKAPANFSETVTQ